MCAAITGAVIAVGTAGYQIYNAEKQKADAKKAIADFKRQDLNNFYEDVQVSTMKADQQTEANIQSTASSIDALQRTGTRGVLGGLPKLNENNILVQNLISQDLEDQDLKRSILIAQGDEKIQAIREGRETNALIGLGQELQTARQDSASGYKNLTSGLLAGASAINEENND